MASEPEVTHLHEEIDKTRSDLTEKIQTLEEQVRGTVLNATEKVEETIEQVTSTVQETVEQVKSTVDETVETAKSAVNNTMENVRQTFDLEYQMRVRPWTMVCGSLCVGVLAGALIGRQSRGRSLGRHAAASFRNLGESVAGGSSAAQQYVSGTRPEGAPPAPSEGPGLLGQLYHQFEPEINQVKEMAIGYAVGMLRDMIKEAVPVLRDKVEEVMNSATTKIGGEPVRGPVLQPSGEGQLHDRGSFGNRGPMH
jgi:ElaB/YqjD/DUF883 family membrane-anchored ribosome-binding protein